MAKVKNNGVVSVAGAKDWETSFDQKVIKKSNQSVPNDSDFSIHFSGPEEEGFIAEAVHADIQSGGNYSTTKFTGGH